ncbi:hypothetical protein CDAR_615211 [Caerostris darwini]|uniref:Uncharacterized protein n=1 Tax=Caerostris darwini TaxID=1538125 RepID=A0AAV4RCD7_9ARAC|nr:hypothetical protein CDAR_615211 [Caerostris darwini]
MAIALSPNPPPLMRGVMGRGGENPLKYPRVQSHKNERQKGGKLFSKECPFFSMAAVILPPYPVRPVVLYPFPGGWAGRFLLPFPVFISRAVVLFSILPGGKDSGEKARL